MRRCSGIWPPSNPQRREYPARDCCPLLPLPAVLPSLEPMPRPTRTFLWREPRGGRKLESFTVMIASIFGVDAVHFHQVPDLEQHSAVRRRIGQLQHLIHAPETQAANGGAHIARAGDEADHPLDA